MISEKMLDMVQNSSAIRAMFEEGKKMAAIYGAENIYDFSLGNPSVEPPKRVKEAIIEVLNHDAPNLVHGYMANSGYEDVRASIAKSINQKFDTNFDASNLVMTVGAAGGLNVILKSLLNPGEEVIVFAPFFGEYTNYVKNYDGILTIISPNTETFQPNLKEFAEKISEKTKAVIINTPNNPTGVVYSEKTIMAMAEIMNKAMTAFDTNIYLIADEPYRELVYDNAWVPYPTKYYENTIVAYSYSKSLSLPGERIGYLVIPSEADDAEDLKSAANVATRILGYVNAPSLMQRTIAKCLEETTDVQAYDKNRKFLYEKLMEYGFECIKPEGAFYLFVKSPIENEKEFVAKAKEYHLLFVPGSSFGCPGYVRLAYCVRYDMIERSLPAFQQLAKFYQ